MFLAIGGLLYGDGCYRRCHRNEAEAFNNCARLWSTCCQAQRLSSQAVPALAFDLSVNADRTLALAFDPYRARLLIGIVHGQAQSLWWDASEFCDYLSL